MLSGEAAISILAITSVFVLAASMPQHAHPKDEKQDQEPQIQSNKQGVPFLEWKNGGIRLNFAGFHAEAGLNGLLDGSRLGGGLYASAGTPGGAVASAGLNGLLGGDGAGGGLYASAGLGNDRPAAAAGLEGRLGEGAGYKGIENGAIGPVAGLQGSVGGGGRANTPIGGRLFAAAGPAGVSLSAGNPITVSAATGGSGDDNTGLRESSPPRRTHIQLISKNGPNKKENLVNINDIVDGPDTGDSDNSPITNEVRRAAPSAPPAPPAPPAPLLYTAEQVNGEPKPMQAGASSINPEQEDAPPSAFTTTAQNQLHANAARTDALTDNNIAAVDQRPTGRWSLRKRLRNAMSRRQAIYSSAHANAQTAGSANILRPEDGVIYERDNVGGFFDDIFNIPISTLGAVNQLLRNNAG